MLMPMRLHTMSLIIEGFCNIYICIIYHKETIVFSHSLCLQMSCDRPSADKVIIENSSTPLSIDLHQFYGLDSVIYMSRRYHKNFVTHRL